MARVQRGSSGAADESTAMTHWRIGLADDLVEVRRLLDANALPINDLDGSKLRHFLVCSSELSELDACVGLEIFDDVALLRSLAVTQARRSQGLGRTAVTMIEEHAAAAGTRAVYLLTTTAAGFFERYGYQHISRDQAPMALQQCAEFSVLCPASATCMTKTLSSTAAS